MPCSAHTGIPFSKIFCTPSVSEKNLNSDDHFDRSFSFTAVEGKPRKQKETTKIPPSQLTNPANRRGKENEEQ
jgi:hypothetical protein